MAIYFTLIFVLNILIIITLVHFQTKRIINTTNSIQNSNMRKEQLTTYELERLEREEEFDDRISRLKDELASQQRIIHNSTIAEELHPLVKNLPHNAIKTNNDNLPDVEVTY